ncbi:hypothetical protein [Inquilinus sp.]|jgi:hypothetical protein|uniref:hypothetical protein n=1 Tax=Inquilinus sp. TaxID=1932117 RepID=UPI003784D90E
MVIQELGLDRLRIPFFIAAAILLFLAILVELASMAVLGTDTTSGLDLPTPGFGIRYLAILDLLLAYAVATMALGLLLPRGIQGRVQGIVGLVLSLLGLLAAIILIFIALGMLILMITLLVAVPFGTIAYLAAWGHFPEDTARITLSLVMLLKLAFCVCLVLAHQRFLQNKGLVILAAVSLGATWVVAFLQSFPPGFLVSIADVIGALVIAIVGAIWLILLLIGSIIAVVASLRSVRLG